MKQEFHVKDIVTFRAYPEQNILARVRGVSLVEGEYIYELCGIDEPLISKTSGRSIKESALFKCPVKFPFKWSD
jgi:hypothetical protein